MYSGAMVFACGAFIVAMCKHVHVCGAVMVVVCIHVCGVVMVMVAVCVPHEGYSVQGPVSTV